MPTPQQIIRRFVWATRAVGLSKFLQIMKDSVEIVRNLEMPTQPQQILIITPHPDDEVFGCGGAYALHAERGDTIHILYVTNGSYGTPDGSYDPSIVETREAEAAAGRAVLGPATVTNWRLPDGRTKVTPELVERLQKLITELQPYRMYVPWVLDNHPDHRTAFKLVAACKPKCQVWQYEMWKLLMPNRFVSIASVLQKKKKAMEAHVSQLACRDYEAGILGLNAYRGIQGEITGPAEAYVSVSPQTLEELFKV